MKMTQPTTSFKFFLDSKLLIFEMVCTGFSQAENPEFVTPDELQCNIMKILCSTFDLRCVAVLVSHNK